MYKRIRCAPGWGSTAKRRYAYWSAHEGVNDKFIQEIKVDKKKTIDNSRKKKCSQHENCDSWSGRSSSYLQTVDGAVLCLEQPSVNNKHLWKHAHGVCKHKSACRVWVHTVEHKHANRNKRIIEAPCDPVMLS